MLQKIKKTIKNWLKDEIPLSQLLKFVAHKSFRSVLIL